MSAPMMILQTTLFFFLLGAIFENAFSLQTQFYHGKMQMLNCATCWWNREARINVPCRKEAARGLLKIVTSKHSHKQCSFGHCVVSGSRTVAPPCCSGLPWGRNVSAKPGYDRLQD
jgi:hypothetical protein